VALDRLKRGNVSNVAGVGESVFELKLDWGPGYRLYFGRDGDRIVILLLGGTKKRQSRDIATAKGFWLDYKSRKPARPK
jgi:putative addiction module killer protein